MQSSLQITICPDAFKGTLTSPGVATAIVGALQASSTSTTSSPTLELFSSPMSDGGHGLLDCLMACTTQGASNGFTECFAAGDSAAPPLTPPYPRGIPLVHVGPQQEIQTTSLFVSPKNGSSLWSGRGRYLIRRSEKYAVVEMAEVGGLPQVEEAARQYTLLQHPSSNGTTLPIKDSRSASSYAVGELLARIGKEYSPLDIKEVFIGLGGSSTNDCGVGMLQALGAEVYITTTTSGGSPSTVVLQEEPIIASELINIDHINFNTDKFAAFLKRWTTTTGSSSSSSLGIQVVCDVTNPLLGESGATAVYGPQKLGTFDGCPVTIDQSSMAAWKTTALKELEAGAVRCQEVLDDVLRKLAAKNGCVTPPVSCGSILGAGAAGGIGAALMGFIVPYSQLLLSSPSNNSAAAATISNISGAEILQGPKFTNVAALANISQVVITGEGAFDHQTIEFGKTVASIYKSVGQGGAGEKSTVPTKKLVVVVCGVADTTLKQEGSVVQGEGWSKWPGTRFARVFVPAAADSTEGKSNSTAVAVDIVVCPLTGFKVSTKDSVVSLQDGFVELKEALGNTAAAISRLVSEEIMPNVIIPWSTTQGQSYL